MLIGIDTSAVDGNKPCNWKQTYAAGARFVILKRSHGTREDACYARDSDAARKSGLVVGAYHFPMLGLSAAPPKAQVAAFKAAAGDIVRGKDLPPTIDLESADWSGRSHFDAFDMIRLAVFETVDAFGCWPMIRTSYAKWSALGLPKAAWASKCPLWLVTTPRVPRRQPVDQVIPATPHFGYDALHDARNDYRVPDPWSTSGWWIQQVQGSAVGFPGANKPVDLNRFNVTRPGAQGPQVSYVQRKLGHDADTGLFDDKLEAALRWLQAEAGLESDGIIDPATLAAIGWR